MGWLGAELDALFQRFYTLSESSVRVTTLYPHFSFVNFLWEAVTQPERRRLLTVCLIRRSGVQPTPPHVLPPVKNSRVSPGQPNGAIAARTRIGCIICACLASSKLLPHSLLSPSLLLTPSRTRPPSFIFLIYNHLLLIFRCLVDLHYTIKHHCCHHERRHWSRACGGSGFGLASAPQQQHQQ